MTVKAGPASARRSSPGAWELPRGWQLVVAVARGAALTVVGVLKGAVGNEWSMSFLKTVAFLETRCR